MRLPSFSTLLCTGSLLLLPAISRAGMYAETSTGFNSHEFTGTAETVPFDPNAVATSLDDLTGEITFQSGNTEGDVFKIYISDPSAFSASTPVGAPNANGFDTQLFLFNLNGTGIESNDNDPNGTGGSSLLPVGGPTGTVSFAPGFYYLAITGSGLYPAISANGTAIFPDTVKSTTYGPSNASATFGDYTGASTEGNQYDISLTGASMTDAVPEPSPAASALLGLAVLTLFNWFRSRRSSKSAA